MHLLILGAGGMAGHLLTIYFQEKGYKVTACSRRKLDFAKNNLLVNIEDFDSIRKILERDSYDIVINCLGVLNQDADANKANAVFINSYIPHFIADFISVSSMKLIHMSTDCVFAGNTGPYYEDSLSDGRTFYDRSKALGEINDNKNLTFRNSIIGPDVNENGIGLFNWFMKQTGIVNGFSKAIWTGVTTLELAIAMEEAIKQNLTGLYNLVNNEIISKYDLLSLFNKNFKNDEIQIDKNLLFVLDKTLLNKRSDFNYEVPSYEEMVVNMKEWVVEHKELYHYKVL